MNFEDTLKVRKVEQEGRGTYDENGNPVVVEAADWQFFGKCVIFPNTSARSVTLVDGKQYVYSFELVAPLSKKKYEILPKEGDEVLITKKDGTIDREMEVKGFVTYKKRYLKLWL